MSLIFSLIWVCGLVAEEAMETVVAWGLSLATEGGVSEPVLVGWLECFVNDMSWVSRTDGLRREKTA